MIIRDVYYNITSIYYSVHYKNRDFKRVRIQFILYSCVKLLVITKSYWKQAECIITYYRIKIAEISEFN